MCVFSLQFAFGFSITFIHGATFDESLHQFEDITKCHEIYIKSKRDHSFLYETFASNKKTKKTNQYVFFSNVVEWSEGMEINLILFLGAGLNHVTIKIFSV